MRSEVLLALDCCLSSILCRRSKDINRTATSCIPASIIASGGSKVGASCWFGNPLRTARETSRSTISGRNHRFRNHARAGACSRRSGPSVRYSSASQKSQRRFVAHLAARVLHHRLKIRKTFKYRLYPNRKQRESLLATLEVCRHLYNDALQERREAWKVCRTSVTFDMQSAQLPACKQADAGMQTVHSQVLEDVLHRVDKTYQAFFRRGKGFPRFKGKGWFDSFTYPQLGFNVTGSQISRSKIGNVKVKLHRPLAGEVKTLTLKNEGGKWYASLLLHGGRRAFAGE